jgi:hypothetical protein
LALLLLTGGAAAQTPAERLPDRVLGTHWYSVTVLGSRSGWSQQTLQRTTWEGRPALENREHTLLRLQLGDRTLSASRQERRVYDSDLRLVKLQLTSDQAGRQTRLQAQREGQTLKVSRESPEGTRQQSFDLSPDFGSELRVVSDLLAGRLKPGEERVFDTFDAELVAVDTVRLQVKQRVTEPVAGWQIEARGKLLQVATLSTVDDNGVLVRQEIPGMMNMLLERVSEAEALAEVTPLPLTGDLRAPSPITDPTKLTRLQVKVHDPEGEAERMFPATPRQKISGAGAEALLTVTAETAPTQRIKLPVTDPALAAYLQPSDQAQSADPAIVARSREIVGGETDAWAAAQRLVSWVYRKVKKVDSEPRPVTATEVLASMTGDCTEHSVLLAALAQAAGLPTRMVVGLAYDHGAFHYHAWNAVWVGRWVEVDATWNQDLVDAGHLQIAAGALDRTASARMNLAAGRTMGGLRLEVAGYAVR